MARRGARSRSRSSTRCCFLALRQRAQPGMPLLSRAFLALAVIFATIAIPFAFDNRATAALWAVEAAGVYWIGVRQKARLARAFALVVEFGAGIAFVASGVADVDDRLFANAFFAGALLIALSALATARIADRAGDALSAGERSVCAARVRLGRRLVARRGRRRARPPAAEHDEAMHAMLAWVTASVAVRAAVAARLCRGRGSPARASRCCRRWPLAAIGDFDRARTTLTVYGWIVWPCAWLVHWWVLRAADARRADAPATERKLRRLDGHCSRRCTRCRRLMLVAQLSWEASEWTGRCTARHTAWTPCAAALPAIAFLALCVRFARPRAVAGRRCTATRTRRAPERRSRCCSPSGSSRSTCCRRAIRRRCRICRSPIRSTSRWRSRLARCSRGRGASRGCPSARSTAGSARRSSSRSTGSCCAPRITGRDIPWRLSSLLASKPLQAALTLTWTATALAMMYVATRRGMRPLWMMGAALLAVVVGKLFLVDLGALSGLPRVVAFLGVGVLLLVIGFLSPLPPASRPATRAATIRGRVIGVVHTAAPSCREVRRRSPCYTRCGLPPLLPDSRCPMSGNTLGTLYCVTSFGESHGPAIGCVVDGCPPGTRTRRGGHPARPRPAQARHVAARHAAARDPTRSRSCPACSKAGRPARRSRSSSATRTRAARTTRRSPTRSAPGTPTTRTGRSTASATIAAAAARRRARRRCASPPAPSRASGSRERYGVAIRGHLVQLGPRAIPFEDWAHVDANPFFVANATIVPELEAFMDALRKSGDSCGAKITVDRERRAGRLGRAGLRPARRRPRARDDGHQRGEGRRDRRGLRERRATRQRAFATR